MGLLSAERYGWWQDSLSDEYLSRADGPLVFFVDEAELGRIATGIEEPSSDLAAAVRDVSSPVPGAYFGRVSRARREWELGDRLTPPPVLPVLALSVLAASRMRSDSQGLSTNYYLRLAESLLPGARHAEVEALRAEFRGDSFDDVVTMWRTLHEWVESQEGGIGRSTIRTHERLTRIGYPRSQALLTRADRATLTRFFRAMDFTRFEPPTEDTLLRGLDIWTSTRQNSLGDTFMTALAEDETRGLIGAVVLAFATAWNGEVITSDGRRRIAMKLGLDLEDWTAEWLFPVEAGAPGTVTLSGLAEGSLVHLEARPPSRYYIGEGVPPVVAENIRGGLRLRGKEFTAEFPRTDVIIFGGDTHTGAWSSVSGVTPYETHVIAAATSEYDAVKRLLTNAADRGWHTMNQGKNAVLPGFFIFENVRFTSDQALHAALREEPKLRSLGVAPTVVPRARFVRGLPLARDLAPNHYLEGGEPDLLIPANQIGELVPMTLGQKHDRVPARGFPFPIRRFPQALGRTDVVADGQTLSYTLLSESPAGAPPKGEGSIGWSSTGELASVTDETRIVGAIVDTRPDARVVMCRRDRDETWLLLDGGAVRECRAPGQPAFTTGAGFRFVPAYFEVDVPADAQWLAQRNGEAWNLTRLTPDAPKTLTASFDVLATWAHRRGPGGTSALWDLQVRMAHG